MRLSILGETDARMSDERRSVKNNNIRTTPIPSGRLWEALTTTLEVFGPSLKDATIMELQKSGIDPQNDSHEYTLAELGDKLSSIFGVDGTEVILDQIARKLRSQNNKDK